MGNVIFNTHDVVLLMTAYQCILFAVLLLTLKREKPLSNLFLALFLLQQAAIPLDILISFGAQFRHVALEWSPNLFYVFGFGYWLEGPFLLWYTRSLVYKDYRLSRRDLIYLAPFFAYLIHEILFYYSLDMGDKKHLQEAYSLYRAPWYMHYVTFARDLFRVVLGFMCLVEIKRYSQHIKTNFSTIDKIDLTWLKLLTQGFVVIRIWSVMVVLLVLLATQFGIKTNFETMGLMCNYVTCLFISLLIFFSLGHSDIFEGLERDSTPEVAKENVKDKFRPEQIDALTEFMQRERPYLVASLTLEKLASQMKMQPRSLSNLINRKFDCNFFEFVNNYRVEAAKKILMDKNAVDKSMLDVMYDVGFNSKATFNTLFKKKVGITPSEFRKLAAKADSENLQG